MKTRHKIPAVFSIYMVDVLCCALGCVILLWQLYHLDLEPNSALFAVKKAAELVHVQLNESNGEVEVINNLAAPLEGARAHLSITGVPQTKCGRRPEAAARTDAVDF